MATQHTHYGNTSGNRTCQPSVRVTAVGQRHITSHLPSVTCPKCLAIAAAKGEDNA